MSVVSILFTLSSLSLSLCPPVWTKWRFCLWCFMQQTSVILPKPGRCTIAGLTVWWRSFSDRSSGKHVLFDCSGYSLVVLWFSSYYSCLIPWGRALIATWAFFLFGASGISLLSAVGLCYSVFFLSSFQFYFCVYMGVCMHVCTCMCEMLQSSHCT